MSGIPPQSRWDDEEADDDLDVFGFVDHGDDDEDPSGPGEEAAAPAPAPAPARRRSPGSARRLALPAGLAAPWRGRNVLAGAHAVGGRSGRNPAALRSTLVLGAAALVVLLVGVVIVRGLMEPADRDAVAGDEVTFTVAPGEDLDSIAARLDEQGIVASRRAVLDAAQEAGQDSVGAGEYVLHERMPAADALATLQGRAEGAAHYVLVGRGRWLTEVLDGLAESTGLPRKDLDAAAADPTRYGVPEGAPSLEGWLAPGEYHPPVDASAEDILAELVKPRLAHLKQQGVTDPAEQQRIVTVASILEAEALPKDYARVAGIIDNRLNDPEAETRGLLQIDSTVNYGLGRRNLQFSAAQRADESNPYNTYQHRGLPPGPIGMPSDAAIDGAVHPVPSDDLYWVTVDIATGRTEFSKTYEEHRRHQEEFRRYCAENPENC